MYYLECKSNTMKLYALFTYVFSLFAAMWPALCSCGLLLSRSQVSLHPFLVSSWSLSWGRTWNCEHHPFLSHQCISVTYAMRLINIRDFWKATEILYTCISDPTPVLSVLSQLRQNITCAFMLKSTTLSLPFLVCFAFIRPAGRVC